MSDRPQGFTLGWDVRPRWGRAVHRNGKKVSRSFSAVPLSLSTRESM